MKILAYEQLREVSAYCLCGLHLSSGQKRYKKFCKRRLRTKCVTFDGRAKEHFYVTWLDGLNALKNK